MNGIQRLLRVTADLAIIAMAIAVVTYVIDEMRERRSGRRWQPLLPPVDATASPTVSVATGVVSPDGDLQWTREEVRSLRRHIDNPTIKLLMELVRERNGAPVNYQELMERSGRTMPQLRADLAVLSRVSRKVVGQKNSPIDVTSPTDGQSKRAYTVPESYLQWWFED